ncbi:polyamine aminopropyltransferase [Tepidibacillus fermentans]|uniref:Polyamine aminopropyltransferase n=1 Tax=Tepidibacillus fermentans TaxID=1281767 RepID=A0A4R3KEB5_9BACI|nr:polyamine aminopropyltransferase [Tepidibacillus fermentans]TCS81299.1 spermidine synthase [Tepidibacillus fermentans]
MKQLPSYIKKENDIYWLTEDERENLKISYRIREIVYFEKSPYQDVMILDSYDFGRMLVLDGVVQTTSIDGYIYNEMISHIPLNFHPNPKRVLIIGGGDLGAAQEVTKYDQVEKIDLVEIDQLVVEASKKYLSEISGDLSDPRVELIYHDGVEFVKNHHNQYDVIIVDSSDPIGPAKQLFEYEFYHHIYRALKEDGIMVCQSQSPLLHFDVLKQTYKHIQTLFPITRLYMTTVPTYPGGFWSFTLGSKKYDQLLPNIPFDKQTRYVNKDILYHSFSLPEFVHHKLNEI